MRIGKILGGLFLGIGAAYAGLSFYVLSIAHLDTVVICAAGHPGLRVPAAACGWYLDQFADQHDIGERNTALAIALSLSAEAKTAEERSTARTLATALIAQGADINAVSPYGGHTPLHAAVLADQPELVRYLLHAGADPSRRDAQRQQTPLEFAVWLETSKQLDRRAVRQALEASP